MMAGHREHSRRLKIHAALSFGYSGARPQRERALVVLQLAAALMVHHVSLGAVLWINCR